MKNHGSDKKDELLRLVQDLNIELNSRSRKKIDNYRYSDDTKIVVGRESVEVRTDFPDGQCQLMDISIDGSGINVHGNLWK